MISPPESKGMLPKLTELETCFNGWIKLQNIFQLSTNNETINILFSLAFTISTYNPNRKLYQLHNHMCHSPPQKES